MSDIRPVNLKCEHCAEPLGIDVPDPAFSWELASNARGARQAACRILVASRPDSLDSEVGDMWDSGRVTTDEQFGHRFAGAALAITSRYWWKVMVWDEDGAPSAWSEPASFVTGIFKASDWQARWLEPQSAVGLARREFRTDPRKAVASAVVYVAALGDKCNSFQLRVNGAKVGEDVFSPGPAEPHRALYRAYEVRGLLRKGLNAVGLLYTKRASLILSITYEDESVQTVCTDDTWKTAPRSPYVFLGYEGPNRGKAEEYDARLESDGWDCPGFDEAEWTLVNIPAWCGRPLQVTAQLVGCQVHQTLSPVSIKRHEGGGYVVDFGQMLSGFVRIRAAGPAGTAVVMRCAEQLDSRGDIGQVSYGVGRPLDHHSKYVLRGGAEETYAPSFMHTSLRYVEVSGYPGQLTPDRTEACFLHSDVLNGSRFECSDPLLNRLQACAERSFRSNLVNIPTDCPGRERRGWTADAFAVSQAECINFDMLRFYYKWFDDIADCQKSSGWIPVELPMSTDPSIDVNWPAACVLIPWDVFQAYGDRDFLARYYPVMRRYVEFLASIADEQCGIDEGYVTYGDWVAAAPATKAFLAMAYYHRCAALLGRIAAQLGRAGDAGSYAALAERIRERFNARFLKENSGQWRYDNHSQSAYAHALFFGLAPAERRREIVETLVQKIREDGTNTTGFLGTMCLLPALSENDRSDVAWSLVTNPGPGGWLHLVTERYATTFPEDYEGRGSQNHAFLGGSLSAWFYRYLVGISPRKPGYREIAVRPFIPDRLSFARARIETIRGPVEAGWERGAGGALRLRVCLPANTTGVVHVPAAREEAVTESGAPAGEAPGVRSLGAGKGCAVYAVGSGEYVFEVAV